MRIVAPICFCWRSETFFLQAPKLILWAGVQFNLLLFIYFFAVQKVFGLFEGVQDLFFGGGLKRFFSSSFLHFFWRVSKKNGGGS